MSQIIEIDPAHAYQLTLDNEAILIDVRENNEIIQAAIEGAIHIPMSLFNPSLIPIKDDKKIIFLCTHGIRSLQVSNYLIAQGIIKDAYNLSGGLAAWIQEGLPIQTDNENIN